MKMKKLPLFTSNENARIHSIPDWEFENTECTIVGVASEFAEDNIHYIIELCHPTKEGWTHAVLTNACLNKVN